MKPDYSTNDPRGWGGDPRRGAALGRPTVQRGDNASFSGKLYLRRVRLDQGGYDPNGTYFGLGQPLYWCADDGSSEDHAIDFMLRADNRDAAKAAVQAKYPNARFFR